MEAGENNILFSKFLDALPTLKLLQSTLISIFGKGTLVAVPSLTLAPVKIASKSTAIVVSNATLLESFCIAIKPTKKAKITPPAIKTNIQLN